MTQVKIEENIYQIAPKTFRLKISRNGVTHSTYHRSKTAAKNTKREYLKNNQ